MSWAIGYDGHWRRDIGYGVPAHCDHPLCHKEINRGLSYVCGGEPCGGDRGCGLYFCGEHLSYRNLCPRCEARRSSPYARPKPEHPAWLYHKLTDASWAEWRSEEPKEAAKCQSAWDALTDAQRAAAIVRHAELNGDNLAAVERAS